jgi:hypothetical protein
MNKRGSAMEYVLPILIALMFFFVITYGLYLRIYLDNKYQSELYNEKFGTHYTWQQFYFAGDTIKSFLNPGRQSTQNYNINGAIPIKIEK